jgi:aspartate kinase
MLTMKFGGTSVGSIDAIANVVDIVRRTVNEGHRVVVVVSAMSGVTDSLLQSVAMATSEDRWGYVSLARKLRDRHEEVVNEFVPPGAQRETALLAVNKLVDQFAELCEAVAILGEATPRIMDLVVSFGERLSSLVVAASLAANGVKAEALDAGQFLMTDSTFQNAQPIWDETEARIRGGVIPKLDAGVTPVITGFIGKTADGHYTTLGRGGSDYSAAIFAAYVDSDEFIVWTDVDGVMTTDPRVDPRAQVLPYVSYQEVGELAYYGAKVLHPKTIQPILDRRIPVRVRNTFNSSHEGTLINGEARPSNTIIKAVTSVRKVSMLTVSGRGMIGVPGIAGRAFLATAQAGGNILMISQSSSEQSFCFTVPDDRAQAVKLTVESELSQEIAQHSVDGIDVLNDIVILTVVGSGMRGTPGVAGSVFTVLGQNRINVLAIAQGSSECSISFVVSEADAEEAIIKLHDLALA